MCTRTQTYLPNNTSKSAVCVHLFTCHRVVRFTAILKLARLKKRVFDKAKSMKIHIPETISSFSFLEAFDRLLCAYYTKISLSPL